MNARTPMLPIVAPTIRPIGFVEDRTVEFSGVELDDAECGDEVTTAVEEVDEEDVESKIDGRDGDEDICRHPHDACAHVSIVRDHACRKVYVP